MESSDEKQISNTIKTYLVENFLFGDDGFEFSDQDSFIDNGIVDSVAILELVLFTQDTFNIEIEDHEILPENFDTIEKLSSFIKSKQNKHQP